MKNAKYTSRELKAKKTKEKLFDIAIGLIKEKGYNRVSINEICKGAGVTKGAFYHHYNTKEEILIQLYKDVDDYYQVRVLDELENKGILDKIKLFIKHHVYCAEGIGVDIVKEIFKGQTNILNQFITLEDRPFYQILIDVIKEGQREKILRQDIPPKDLCNYIIVFSRGLIQDWYMKDGAYDINEKSEKYLDIFINSLR